MTPLSFQLVGVFGDAPFEGNPAAVFLDGSTITADAMQALARSIGGTGTAFALPPTRAGADIRVRTILGDDEPSFFAHTVLGTLHALLRAGTLEADVGQPLAVEVADGVLTARLERRDGEATSWALRLDPTPGDKLVPDIKALMKATLLVHDDFELLLPIERARPFLLVPVPNRESLRRLTPDDRALAAYVRAREVDRIAFFCVESREPLQIAARVLAPASPASEDAVTGTLHSALASYLAANGVIRGADGPTSYEVTQGDRFGRIGRLTVRLRRSGRTVTDVEVVGTCRTWIDGSR